MIQTLLQLIAVYCSELSHSIQNNKLQLTAANYTQSTNTSAESQLNKQQ